MTHADHAASFDGRCFDCWRRLSPPEPVDDEPWPNEVLTADRSRDTVLLCIAGMVIIAILAFVAGRAS